MKYLQILFLSSLFLIAACASPTESNNSGVDSMNVVSEDETESTEEIKAYTQDDQDNIQRLIRLTLNDLFKEDLDQLEIDSIGRQFIYDQVDLNNDGKKEILIGLIGPYFCGSGGCTVLLTNGYGDLITQFSVSDYPFYVDQETSNGWNSLIIYSGSENRLVKFDGETYPSNPSTLEVYSGDVDRLLKLLDIENQERKFF
ncbi:hypothetical protein ACFOSV_01830 [Algoriphagus namhaensis]|uniref:VCBS repeat-containing protein n=1 Tax=Algoriphagus namhaensis TaxID=915353 RepID=A0ABV8AQ41_9BACT